jgi:hypothetical protein
VIKESLQKFAGAFFIRELHSNFSGGYGRTADRELERDWTNDPIALRELSGGDERDKQNHRSGNPFLVFHTLPPIG